jgi:hypothetical protein
MMPESLHDVLANRMGDLSQRENRYLSFSNRLALSNAAHYRIPSQEDVQDHNDINSFENEIPDDQQEPGNKLFTGVGQRGFDAASGSSGTSLRGLSRLSALIWPAMIITFPIALLCGVLLGMIYGYRVRSEPSLFSTINDEQLNAPHGYLLINYSATRLVIIASFISTLAPILAGSIMLLWTFPIAQSMRIASSTSQYSQLPTPYQLSLVIGISLASHQRLWRYYEYMLSRTRSTIPPILHKTAGMLTCAVLLAVAVFVTDTYLHYTTQTIDFDQIAIVTQPTNMFSRALSKFCLDFNRAENGGLPCSLASDPNAVAEQNEIFHLQHNSSSASEIRFVHTDNLLHGDVALLVPQSQSFSQDVDFRASTIGVSSQCISISTDCEMRYDTQYSYHTLFNCSDNFWGVLGKSPNISEVDGTFYPTPYVPPLGYKPAPNLQLVASLHTMSFLLTVFVRYSFFADQDLHTIYNSVGYDTETDQPTSPNQTSIPDVDLLNPIYLAFAGRIPALFESAGSTLNEDPGIFASSEPGAPNYADFVLRCSLTTYEVEYSWVNGSIEDVSLSTSPNGTLLEIFHGSQSYIQVTGGDHDLQDYLQQAALQNTSNTFATAFANLYSTKILSTIGAYATGQTALQEQTRTRLLVAKVQVSALGALVGCSLAYTVLGIGLAISASRASSTDVRDIAAQLSLPGLTAAAFGKKAYVSEYGRASNGAVFNEKLTRRETSRVVVDGSPQHGYEFRVYV